VLDFAAGQAAASFVVVVNDEAYKQEGSESFAIVLDQASGVTLGDASATVTLTDDFVAAPAVPLAMVNTALQTSGTPALDPYVGPLNYLAGQFVFLGSDGIVLSAAAPNVFLRSGSGNDALQVAAGQNVLDAGTGSNFLTGGLGADTFFLDARGATETIWSTVENLTAGDGVTLWGISATSHALTWTDGLGAEGHQGLTMRANAAGQPEVLVTLAGMTGADRTGPAPRFAVQFGFDAASGSDYLFLFALG
jgi:serralysin